MMSRLFPRALFACINEGRPPNADELSCVTRKILRETFGQSGDADFDKASTIARAALFGSAELP